MSFLSLLGYGAGGYAQGAQQRLQNQQTQEQMDIQKQQAAQNQQLNNAYLTQQDIANKQAEKNTQFEQGLKLPTNWSKLTPQQQYQYYQQRLTHAQAAGDTQAVTDTLAAMNSLTYEPERFANANVANARVGLINAQAAAERDLPARAREIARGKNDAQIAVAGQRYAQAVAVAGIAASSRQYVANLAGAYHLAGINDQDAVREAIADYNGRVSMYNRENQTIGAENNALLRAESYEKGQLGGLSPLDPNQPQTGFPPININVGQQPGTPYLPPPPMGYGQPGYNNGQPQFPAIQRPKGETGKIDTGEYAPPKVLQDAWGALRAGKTPQEVGSMLQGFVNKGLISPQIATSVEQMLHTGSGGSYNAGNPPLGVSLPPNNIYGLFIQNGATPQDAEKLTAIAMAESSGKPYNVNPTDNHGKQTSWGLMQISDGTHTPPPNWWDPNANVQMAIQKLHSQGWGAWGTYGGKAYNYWLKKLFGGQ